MRSIPHHLISIVQPDTQYSVQDWLKSAKQAQEQVLSRGGLPIFVGGTHMYAKAYLDGLEEAPGRNEAYRKTLMKIGVLERYETLRALNPEAAARLHPNDEKRVIRALEKISLPCAVDKNPHVSHGDGWRGSGAERGRTLVINLAVERHDYPQLENYIDLRTNEMVESGLEEEVKCLLCNPRRPLSMTAQMAIGYNEMVDILSCFDKTLLFAYVLGAVVAFAIECPNPSPLSRLVLDSLRTA